MRSEGGGRDGQMEEWDPRDVSFITPSCNLHFFTLSLSLFFLSLSSSHHPSVHFFVPRAFIAVTLPLSSRVHLFVSFLPSLHPSILHSVLWQPFLGFSISSGDIPPFFSPFSPPSLALAIFFSTFFGKRRRKICFIFFPRKTKM